jgi:hypothetical protein
MGDEQLAALGLPRREFLKKAVAAAFVAPVIVSFAIDAIAEAEQSLPNQSCPNQSFPNQSGQLLVQFLRPLDQSTDPNNPVINTGKNGRVIPVKVLLTQGGMPVTDQGAVSVTILVTRVATSGNETNNPVESYADAGNSSAGSNEFRYDGAAWSYNLDTQALGLTTGISYRIDVLVNGCPVLNAFAVFQPTK